MNCSWCISHDTKSTTMHETIKLPSQIIFKGDEPHKKILIAPSSSEDQPHRVLQSDTELYPLVTTMNSLDITKYLSTRKFGISPSALLTSMYQPNATQVWVIGSQSVLRINVSDYTSPQIIDVVDILLMDSINDIIYDITPDGQYFVCLNTQTHILYLTSVSKPYRYINLSISIRVIAQGIPLAYCANGKTVFVVTNTTNQE